MSDRTKLTVYVETTREQVTIEQLENPREYRISGQPNGVARECDETVTNKTELDSVYARFGLIETGTLKAAAKQGLGRFWALLEIPATQPWSYIRTVNEWKH